MNKQNLIEKVAAETGLSIAHAAKAVDGILQSITKELGSGGDVRLVGFGSFTTSKRKASTGRNPKTGQAMQIPAFTVARFKAGKALKDSIN